MAVPTVTKQVIENGPRNYVAVFTWAWDSGHLDNLSAYVALDPTSGGDMGVSIAGNTLYPGTHLKIVRMGYDAADGIGVQLYWDATTPTNAYIFNGTGAGKQNFRPQGGLFVPQNAGAPITGATGKLLINTLGTPAANDFVSLNVFARKDISQ